MARYAKSLGFAKRTTAPATPASGYVEMYLMGDGKFYEKDDIGTETEIGSGGGGGGGVTDITYADLVTSIGNSALTAGAYYRITDFATRHYIVDGGGTRYSGAGNEITGATEPLIILAASTNTISHEAKSALYPQDIIHYDWNPANWMDDLSFADAESAPATAIITGFKGVIYFRHDTLLDNYCGYDFRNCKFRRWETALGNGIYTSLVDTTFASTNYLTFNPTVTSYENTCRGNHIEGFKDGYSLDEANGTILGNNVFHLDSDDWLTMGNTIQQPFYNNTIGSGFHNNIIASGFHKNTIGSGFSRNVVGSGFYNNIMEGWFSNNTVGSEFTDNTVGGGLFNECICNTIGNKFTGNIIGGGFHHNKIEDGLNYELEIGIDFTSATHVYAAYDCTIYIRPDGTAKLRYYNDSDALVVVAANA